MIMKQSPPQNLIIQVPFYGQTGLNAGIMHMDLNRMRDIPDGWTRASMAMHDKYKPRIKLADQVMDRLQL